MSDFSAKAKRIIALLFVSNILFAVSAVYIWRSGSTRVAALTSTLNSISAMNEAQAPFQEREAPVRAAEVAGNFTNEMKIPYTAYAEEMESKEERTGDHPGSPYFYNFDFYNAESTDTLKILPHFRTIQQAKNFSCGIASIQMVLDYYGVMGDWNEETLLKLVPPHLFEDGTLQHEGYCLEQLIEVFNQIGGFDLRTTYDYREANFWDVDVNLFKSFIDQGIPVIVGDIDRGGHWKVIIGYDDMGTSSYRYDDIFIFADSNDTTDHNADGYAVENAEKFFASFEFYTMDKLYEDHLYAYCFIAPKPIN